MERHHRGSETICQSFQGNVTRVIFSGLNANTAKSGQTLMMLSRWQCQAGADQIVFRYGGFADLRSSSRSALLWSSRALPSITP